MPTAIIIIAVLILVILILLITNIKIVPQSMVYRRRAPGRLPADLGDRPAL